MIFKLIRKISEFEDIFATGIILPESGLSNSQINYTLLSTEEVNFSDDEFIIEFKHRLDSDFLKIDNTTYAYPRVIYISKNNIVTIKFKTEKLAKIFSGRMHYLSEIKDRSYYSKKVSNINNKLTHRMFNLNYEIIENPIYETEKHLAKVIDSLWGMLYYTFIKNFTILVTDTEIKKNYEEYQELFTQKSSMKSLRSKSKEFKRKLINRKFKICDLEQGENQKVIPNFDSIRIDEYKIFNFLAIELVNRSDNSFKDELIRLGENIKLDQSLRDYLPDFRSFYDIYINGNMNKKISDIKSDVIKSLLIAFLHHKNIRSLDETCRMHLLDRNPSAYIFAGILMGYENIHGSYIEKIYENDLLKILIENEKKDNILFVRKYYKTSLDDQLLLFNDEELLFEQKNKQIFYGKGKFVHKNFRRSILRVESEEYKIIFNEAKTKVFIESRKNRPEVLDECRYQSYKAIDLITFKKLNSINAYVLAKELSQYTNKRTGEVDEEYPY